MYSIAENNSQKMICSRKILLGYGIVVITVLCFVASGVSVQALQKAVPDFELSLFRYSGTALAAGVAIVLLRKPLYIPKEHYGNIVIMGTTSLLFNFFYYFAVSVLPLAHVSGLTQSLRMIAVSILMSFTSRTWLEKLTIVAICGCTIGSFFVVQPWSAFSNGFIPEFLNTTSSGFSYENKSHDNNLTCCGELQSSWVAAGYISILFGSIMDAIYLVVVGGQLKNVDSFNAVFFSSLLCVPISLIMSLYMEQPTVIMNPNIIPLVLIHVAGIAVTIITEVMACQIIGPLQTSIVENLCTILNLVPQYTFMSAYLYGRRNAMEIAGCIVITVSLILSGLPSVGNYHEDLNP